MHGIHYVLDANHIKHDNIAKAVQAINSLPISLGTVNHFIAETIDLAEDETVPKIDDLDQARATLAYIVQTGLKKKVKTFSLDAFEEFKNRAESMKIETPQPVTLYTNRINDSHHPAVSAVERVEKPQVNSPNSPAPVKVKGTRNRKANPNSNLSRAKALYSDAVDKSRDAIVALYVKELGIEQGTATTYYYLAKKG